MYIYGRIMTKLRVLPHTVIIILTTDLLSAFGRFCLYSTNSAFSIEIKDRKLTSFFILHLFNGTVRLISMNYLFALGFENVHRLPIIHGSLQLYHSCVHVRHGRNAEIPGLLLHFMG